MNRHRFLGRLRAATMLTFVAGGSAASIAAPIVVATNIDAGVMALAQENSQIVNVGGTGVMKAKAYAGPASAASYEYQLKKNADASFDAVPVTPLPELPNGIQGVHGLRLSTPTVVGPAASAVSSTSFELSKKQIIKDGQQRDALEAHMMASADVKVDNKDARPYAKAEVGDPLQLSSDGSIEVMLQLHAGTWLAGGPTTAYLHLGTGGAIDDLLSILLEVDDGGAPDLRVQARVRGQSDTALADQIDRAFAFDGLQHRFFLPEEFLLFDGLVSAPAAASDMTTLQFGVTTAAGVPEPASLALACLALTLAMKISWNRRASPDRATTIAGR